MPSWSWCSAYYVAPTMGPAALVIGAMRYAYGVAGGLLPWLRAPLPTRYSAKVVAAIQGIVLVLRGVWTGSGEHCGRARGHCPGSAGLVLQPRCRLAVAAPTSGSRGTFRHTWPRTGVGRRSRPFRSPRRSRPVSAPFPSTDRAGRSPRPHAFVLPGQPGAVGPAALHLPLEAVLGSRLAAGAPGAGRDGPGHGRRSGARVLTILRCWTSATVNVLSQPFGPRCGLASRRLRRSAAHRIARPPGGHRRAGRFLALVLALLVVVTFATASVTALMLRRREVGAEGGRPARPGLRGVPRPRCGSVRAPRSPPRAPRGSSPSVVAAWWPGRASSARSRRRARRTRSAGWTRTSCWPACAARTWWSPSSRAMAATP